MKKIILSILVCFILCSCSPNFKGIWYNSDDTLVLKDKLYSSNRFTFGKENRYEIIDNSIILKTDFGNYELEIISNDELVYKQGDVEHRYFRNKKQMEKEQEKLIREEEIKRKIKEEQEKKEEEINKSILATEIVGVWKNEGYYMDRIIEFTEDNKYKFQNYKDNVWTFEIESSKSILITKDDGQVYSEKIVLKKENDTFILKIGGIEYIKSE